LVSRLLATLVLVTSLGACAGLQGSPPIPDPVPFPEISGQLGRFGVDVLNWTAGDAGCDDPTLAPTAIRFEAQGLDQPDSVQLRIYIFRNRDAWERRQADVDACAAAWATDPSTFVIIQTSPYVLAGQGPWGPQFEAAVRKALTESAGTGGRRRGAPADAAGRNP
jgi:hypothetical protein